MLNLPTKDLNVYRVEQARTHYFFPIPAGTPLSMVLSSDYWVHLRGKFRLYDVIEVVAEDGSFEATARIVSLNKMTGVIVFRVLSQWQPSETPVPLTETKAMRFKAAWIVGNRSWSVQEIQTGKYVAEGLADKPAAEAEAVRLDQERKAA